MFYNLRRCEYRKNLWLMILYMLCLTHAWWRNCLQGNDAFNNGVYTTYVERMSCYHSQCLEWNSPLALVLFQLRHLESHSVSVSVCVSGWVNIYTYTQKILCSVSEWVSRKRSEVCIVSRGSPCPGPLWPERGKVPPRSLQSQHWSQRRVCH